jgi:hypothetical protein
LLRQESIGFSIVFLLAGLWFILDNPLESFETLEGFCPYCGQEIRIRRRDKFKCPFCEEGITLEPSAPYPQNGSLSAKSQSVAGEKVLADSSQKKSVAVGLGDTLDLHTFLPKEVSSLVDEFIRVSQRDGLLLVKIVHGKGTGVLRRRVHGLLANDPRVADFYKASPKSGGWGATVVELRPGKEPEGEAGG